MHQTRTRFRRTPRHTVDALLLILLMLAPGIGQSSGEIESYALVQEDGSLLISGHRIHLFGIYIPPTERTCRTFIVPVQCAPRAVLALDFKVDPYFVRCDPKGRNPDGSLVAVCWANEEDLGAWMLTQGWALARPEAPFEYHALEKIARAHGLGVWGMQVDIIERGPRKR